MGRFQDALNDYDKAVDESRDAISSLYARGVVKLKLGDKDGGRKDIDYATGRGVIVARQMAERGVAP